MGLASSSTISTGMGGMFPRPRPPPPPPEADSAPPPHAAAAPSTRRVTNSGGFSDFVINKVVRPNRMQGPPSPFGLRRDKLLDCQVLDADHRRKFQPVNPTMIAVAGRQRQ